MYTYTYVYIGKSISRHLNRWSHVHRHIYIYIEIYVNMYVGSPTQYIIYRWTIRSPPCVIYIEINAKIHPLYVICLGVAGIFLHFIYTM